MPHTGKRKLINTKGKPNEKSRKKGIGRKPPDKRGRLIIRNLPFKTTEESLKKHFISYGKISEVKLLRRPDGNLVGCGFVQFSKREKAAIAVEALKDKEFMGRKVEVDWAKSKALYLEENPPKDPWERGDDNDLITDIKDEADWDDPSIHEGEKSSSNTPNGIGKGQRKAQKRKEAHVEEGNEGTGKKKTAQGVRNKKGRLIVRNLPFKVTEDIMKEHFEKFGELSEVKLLRKPDGKLVGCGFLQYKVTQHAAKAILGASGQPLMGRLVILDWAVPKTTFMTANSKALEAKVEEEAEVKVEESEVEAVKEETEDEAVKEETDLEEEDNDEESEEESRPEHKRIISNDVTEGRTIFVKNVPFTANNDHLRAVAERFGAVVYALVCTDPLTEHSKGTGFIKFETTESANACLAAGTELQLHKQILDCHKALSRDEAQNKNRKESKEGRDSRHLYLIKEGVILAGSPAAAGVSPSDMARRLQLEQWKSQMLRNLNMFVSRTRLIVHNLPTAWDDAKLRALVQQHSSPEATVKECRVMRNIRNLDIQGQGTSKEYGFVTFASHEHALETLRSMNNNPNIFTPVKRPIVAFSIEDRAILNAKLRRLEKSRVKNPLHGDKTSKEPHKGRAGGPSGAATQGTKESLERFVGVTAQPGKTKLRSRYKLKNQATIHHQAVRNDKRKQKFSRKVAQTKNEKKNLATRKQELQKEQGRRHTKRNKEEAVFNSLVNKYTERIASACKAKKWFE